MSSTDRGRGRNTLDQYETPWEAVAPDVQGAIARVEELLP